MITLRQQVEQQLGVGTDQPTARSAPSAWRKTIKYWFALGVGFVAGAVAAGVIAVLISAV